MSSKLCKEVKATTYAWVKSHDQLLSKLHQIIWMIMMKILMNTCIYAYSNCNLEFKWKEIKFIA